MPARSRRSLATLAAVVLAAPLAACGGGGGGGGGCDLTIYSGRTEELVAPILDRFADETGTDICVRYGDSAELALLIEQEGDNSPADLYISQTPGAMGFLGDAGRLRPLAPATLDLVEDRFESPAGTWVGLSGRVRVLVYNTDTVDPATLPGSVLDLTAPEFSGRVALAPTNGSFQDFVTAIRDVLGEEATSAWLDGMAANDPVIEASNTAIVQAVSQGRVEMGLVNHYYALRALKEDPDAPVANYFFDDGDVGKLVLVTAAGVLDTADHPEPAEDLVAFLLGAESQQYFSEETLEYPLAAGVAPTAELADQPIDAIVTPEQDLSQLGGGLERTQELIRDSGLGR